MAALAHPCSRALQDYANFRTVTDARAGHYQRAEEQAWAPAFRIVCRKGDVQSRLRR